MHYPIALVLLGLVLAIFHIFPPVCLTYQAAFYLLLPPILFQGGLHLDRKFLRKDWKPITLLSVPGVVLSAMVIGCILSLCWHIPLIVALLFGALISPTDPVSVLAIIKKLKTPPRLRTILEAESLFNDGTGVVLFGVLMAMFQNKEAFHPLQALGEFLLVTAGGIAVGGLCSYVVCGSIKLIKDPVYSFISILALVFGTPILADKFHCSGIMAIVTAGVVMGRIELHQKTIKFWNVLDIICNSIIFLIIGLQLEVIGFDHLIFFKWAIILGIIAALTGRALTVYLTALTGNPRFPHPIPWRWNHLLFWGGLRGTIPIILMQQLPEDFQYRTLFLSVTFGIVLFSLIVQALTTEGLLKKLRI